MEENTKNDIEVSRKKMKSRESISETADNFFDDSSYNEVEEISNDVALEAPWDIGVSFICE